MKNSYKFLSYFLVIFACFIIVDSVSADDYTKSIRCYYKGTRKTEYRNTSTGQTTISNTFPFVYGVQYRCNDKKCSSRSSWANGVFSDSGLTVNVTNYDDYFSGNNLDKFESLFGYKKNKGFSRCPKYLDYTGPSIGAAGIKKDENNWIAINSFTDEVKAGELIETEMNADNSGLEEKVSSLASKYHGKIEEHAEGSPSNDGVEKEGSNEEYADVISNWAKNHRDETLKDKSKYDDANCTGLLENIDKELKSGIVATNIIGAIILVLTMSVDFVKAISSGDADIMATTFKRCKNRIIATIILLLLPILLNFVIDIVNNNVIKTKTGKIKIGKTTDCIK